MHPATVAGANQDLVVQFNQVFFSQVFLDLASRFERFSNGAGGTLLDDSLLAWGQENGNTPHFSFSVPVVTAGSAGGALKTGSYCDYRNITRKVSGDSSTGSEGNFLWSGLLYNQWLGTALQAMGIPKSEWSEPAPPRLRLEGVVPVDLRVLLHEPGLQLGTGLSDVDVAEDRRAAAVPRALTD
ncbi:hypothetical protein [Corallococcus sp. AB011P]|uniref:hypothetical protein n=1 Tax=Corallococcus sp. AB011P TaxID=2316735 RepID=UPI001F2D90E8|nr:hypothetical protein [Corallococcus sp. AB011P]